MTRRPDLHKLLTDDDVDRVRRSQGDDADAEWDAPRDPMGVSGLLFWAAAVVFSVVAWVLILRAVL